MAQHQPPQDPTARHERRHGQDPASVTVKWKDGRVKTITNRDLLALNIWKDQGIDADAFNALSARAQFNALAATVVNQAILTPENTAAINAWDNQMANVVSGTPEDAAMPKCPTGLTGVVYP